MGFCRRCGNIVSGPRCACGGAPVAPVVSWKTREASSSSQDSWSKTYTAGKRSVSPSRLGADRVDKFNGTSTSTSTTPSWVSKPFPTSKATPTTTSSTSNISNSPALKSSINAHIARTTQSAGPPSPLKKSTTVIDTDSDILPSFLPHEPTLSKVYGSILQPKESLPLHSCAICTTIFPPDATIYPNTAISRTETSSFLCKNCFISNGGTKGTCPGCSRPVLILKTEGEYIESSGKYWHKGCFNCAGCFKNIGNSPMVDLLGRPSCVACFDTCLRRTDPTTPKRSRTTSNNNTPTSAAKNLGGLNSDREYGRSIRESSPAIEELEQRLGISKSRETSPVTQRLRRASSNVEGTISNPLPHQSNSAQRLKDAQFSTTRSPTKSASKQEGAPLSSNYNSSQYQQADPFLVSTPPNRTLLSSSGNVPSYSPRSSPTPVDVKKSPISSPPTFSRSSNLTCQKCLRNILNTREGGQFVTLPGSDENTAPGTYHIDCFKCVICEKALSEPKQGHATYSKTESGLCHLHCIPQESPFRRSTTTTKLFQNISAETDLISEALAASSQGNNAILPASSRYERPAIPSPPKPSFPRFGGSGICPGCQKSVSPMERGVVPGPQGTRWHSSCLVCGGKKPVTTAVLLGRTREERSATPGCGKKLDSAAKSDGEGGVWCRECLLLIGVGGSPQASPTRPGVVQPQLSGRSSKVPAQGTGTTLARQFTGVTSNGDRELLRQLTGGGTSPTRGISPTKQLRMRPKSYYG